MKTATVTVDADGEAVVRSPYDPDFVLELKGKVPTHARRWDRARKLWTVAPAYVDPVLELLRVRWHVDVIRADGAVRPVPADRWAAPLFARLPERLRDPAYKALARVLHPDAGGDGRAMQELNDTYRRGH